MSYFEHAGTTYEFTTTSEVGSDDWIVECTELSNPQGYFGAIVVSPECGEGHAEDGGRGDTACGAPSLAVAPSGTVEGDRIGRVIPVLLVALIALAMLGRPALAEVAAPANQGFSSAPRTTSLFENLTHSSRGIQPYSVQAKVTAGHGGSIQAHHLEVVTS